MMNPRLAAAALALAAGCATASDPQPPEAPALAGEPSGPAHAVGFFSTGQAERGRQFFEQVCYECHETSEFRGDDFEWDWRRRTVWDFYREISRNMPEDFPGTLAAQTYVDVIAYILELNGYAAGAAELGVNETEMDNIPLGPGVNKTGLTNDGGNP